MTYPDEPDFDAPVAPEPEPAEVRQAQPDLRHKVSYLPEIHRMLPQDPEAEKGLLCSMFLLPREVFSVCEELGITPEMFYIPAHAVIYRRAALTLETKGGFDFVTLTGELRDHNELDQAGGAASITEISMALPTAAEARRYALRVKDKHTLRRIITTCTNHAALTYDEQGDAAASLEAVEKDILAIRSEATSEIREEDPKEAVMRAIHNIEATYESRGAVTGQTSGFPELDEMIDGLRAGEMIVIAARPSMGKTAFALRVADHIAIDCKKHVAIFTLEMSTHQIMQRVLLSRARVNIGRVRKGFLDDKDFPAITKSAECYSQGNFRPLELISPTINTIAAISRRMKRRYPDLAAIIVDYLQLVRSKSKQAQSNREREIAEVSAGLKGLAKELQIPVIVLAQLNRDVEKRGGSGRPRLSDLRESGSIEQDADVVGLLHREDYYAQNDEERRELEGRATLIIAKNRNGPTGDIPLTFIREFARYDSRAREDDASQQNEHPSMRGIS